MQHAARRALQHGSILKPTRRLLSTPITPSQQQHQPQQHQFSPLLPQQSPSSLKWSQMSTSDRKTSMLGALTTLGLIGIFSSPEMKETIQQIDQQYSQHSSQLPTLSQIINSNPIQITTPQLDSILNSLPSSTPDLSLAPSLKSIDTKTRAVLTQPATIDGRLWPTYNNYMIAQGYQPGTSQFNQNGTTIMMATFLGVHLLYLGLPYLGVNKTALEDFYMRNMTLSFDNRKKPWTYFTNTITHFGPFHVLANTMAFQSFASQCGVLTTQGFLAMFFGLALVSSATGLALTLGLSRAALHFGRTAPGLMMPSVGASGVIAAMVSMCAFTNPNNQVSFFGVTPSFGILPAMATFMTLDCIGLLAQAMGRRSPLSHGGHIGGYVAGVTLFMLTKERFESQYRRDIFSFYGNWIENTIFPDTSRNIAISRTMKALRD